MCAAQQRLISEGPGPREPLTSPFQRLCSSSITWLSTPLASHTGSRYLSSQEAVQRAIGDVRL